MKIQATYQNPAYRYERVMCGINSFRNASYPNGFETVRINANSLEQLKDYISVREISFEHYGPRRTLRMQDVTIKIIEE